MYCYISIFAWKSSLELKVEVQHFGGSRGIKKDLKGGNHVRGETKGRIPHSPRGEN